MKFTKKYEAAARQTSSVTGLDRRFTRFSLCYQGLFCQDAMPPIPQPLLPYSLVPSIGTALRRILTETGAVFDSIWDDAAPIGSQIPFDRKLMSVCLCWEVGGRGGGWGGAGS